MPAKELPEDLPQQHSARAWASHLQRVVFLAGLVFPYPEDAAAGGAATRARGGSPAGRVWTKRLGHVMLLGIKLTTYLVPYGCR